MPWELLLELLKERDAINRQDEFQAVYGIVVAELGDRTAQFDFASIKKEMRGVVGFVGQCAVRALEQPLDDRRRSCLEAAERALGADVAEAIRRAVLQGPPGGAMRILGWHKWDDERSEVALVAALSATGEKSQVGARKDPRPDEAALEVPKGLAPTPTPARPRSSGRGRGRGDGNGL